jgi:hypothetical protein
MLLILLVFFSEFEVSKIGMTLRSELYADLLLGLEEEFIDIIAGLIYSFLRSALSMPEMLDRRTGGAKISFY